MSSSLPSFRDNQWLYPLTFLLPTNLLHPGASQRWDGLVVTQADYQALQTIKASLSDPHGVLRSWNDTGLTACSGSWEGIKCAQGQVIVLQLPWLGLGGRVSENVSQLAALRKLSLHDNRIGGLIPAPLGVLPDLRGLLLFNNLFVGQIPPELGNCPSLQTLDLSSNSLVGVVPAGLFTTPPSFTGSILATTVSLGLSSCWSDQLHLCHVC